MHLPAELAEALAFSSSSLCLFVSACLSAQLNFFGPPPLVTRGDAAPPPENAAMRSLILPPIGALSSSSLAAPLGFHRLASLPGAASSYAVPTGAMRSSYATFSGWEGLEADIGGGTWRGAGGGVGSRGGGEGSRGGGVGATIAGVGFAKDVAGMGLLKLEAGVDTVVG
jgi:hypothetical protein